MSFNVVVNSIFLPHLLVLLRATHINTVYPVCCIPPCSMMCIPKCYKENLSLCFKTHLCKSFPWIYRKRIAGLQGMHNFSLAETKHSPLLPGVPLYNSCPHFLIGLASLLDFSFSNEVLLSIALVKTNMSLLNVYFAYYFQLLSWLYENMKRMRCEQSSNLSRVSNLKIDFIFLTHFKKPWLMPPFQGQHAECLMIKQCTLGQQWQGTANLRILHGDRSIELSFSCCPLIWNWQANICWIGGTQRK